MCIGLFKKENFNIVSDSKDADIIVVNTCGFIEPAKQEAISTILEMTELKKTGRCKYLIVMGCLVQRYRDELERSLPEVDLFLKIDDYKNIWLKICELIGKKPDVSSQNTLEYENRIISTGDKTAYLKIAEGCSNNCTYCAIPYIRGKYISRPFEDILKEAKNLRKNGIEEIIIIAQDTTKYGLDLYNKRRLPELLEEVSKLGFKWVRFLYSYPEDITDELIEVVKNNDNICKYFDIPIQHYSDSVLKKMNRKSNSSQIDNLLEKIRKALPDVILRTSLIVGFPGETEEDFQKLYDFVGRAKFEKLGVFKYSKEDGTPASRLKDQINSKTKQKRLDLIMSLEQKISTEKLNQKVGNTYETLIDGVSDDNKYYIGRSYMDIPNEDGVVFVPKLKDGLVGKFVKCRITESLGYDLVGEIL